MRKIGKLLGIVSLSIASCVGGRLTAPVPKYHVTIECSRNDQGNYIFEKAYGSETYNYGNESVMTPGCRIEPSEIDQNRENRQLGNLELDLNVEE